MPSPVPTARASRTIALHSWRGTGDLCSGWEERRRHEEAEAEKRRQQHEAQRQHEEVWSLLQKVLKQVERDAMAEERRVYMVRVAEARAREIAERQILKEVGGCVGRLVKDVERNVHREEKAPAKVAQMLRHGKISLLRSPQLLTTKLLLLRF